MGKIREFECPYYQIIIDEDDCYDRYMIASGLFTDDELVKEDDKKALLAMCEKCKKHGLN